MVNKAAIEKELYTWFNGFERRDVTIDDAGRVSIEGDCVLRCGPEILPVTFLRVSGTCDFSNSYLKSLVGSPRFVGELYDCSDCEITTLNGAPRNVGSFNANKNNITSLQWMPNIIRHSVNVSETKISSLNGCPSNIPESFSCEATAIRSLDGAPETVGGVFYCGRNYLKNFIGGPKSVGTFHCGGSRGLESFIGLPETISNSLHLPYMPEVGVLDLVTVKNTTKIYLNCLYGSDEQQRANRVISIVSKYMGSGPKGMIACAAELIQSGFAGNAHR